MSQSDESSDEGAELPTAGLSTWKRAPVASPTRTGALLRLPWGRVGMVFLGLVGLVAQMLLLNLAWELWDLSVSLMEVWAELARKHLEITLTR